VWLWFDVRQREMAFLLLPDWSVMEMRRIWFQGGSWCSLQILRRWLHIDFGIAEEGGC